MTDTNSSNLNGMLWDQAPPNPCPLESTAGDADSPADNSCSAATQASALDGLVAAQGTPDDRLGPGGAAWLRGRPFGQGLQVGRPDLLDLFRQIPQRPALDTDG